MNEQEFKSVHPIFIFQYTALAFIAPPLGIGLILWSIGAENGKSFLYILNVLWAEGSSSFIYSLACFLFAFFVWNIRLTITQSKIYYSVFGLQVSFAIQKHEIAYSTINPAYDTPGTLIMRKFKKFDSPESLEKFNQRFGTVEFVFIKKQPIHWLKHKLCLIRLICYSKKQAQSIIQTLEQHWQLKAHEHE